MQTLLSVTTILEFIMCFMLRGHYDGFSGDVIVHYYFLDSSSKSQEYLVIDMWMSFRGVVFWFIYCDRGSKSADIFEAAFTSSPCLV